MSDAIRPTGDNTDESRNTNAERADRKEADRTMDKTAEQRDAEKASRESGTATGSGTKPFGGRTGDGKSTDGRTGDTRTTDDKSAPRGSEKVTPLGSSERTPTASTPTTTSTTSSREADRAIPSPRTGDTTGTDRSDRTDRSEPSARPVHAPEPAPAVSTGAASGNGRRVPQDAENGSLLAHDESDKFSLRLQHAVTGFVDEPRSAVEEADHVLEEVAARFTEAVTKRRATLHGSWESKGADGSDDTEQLRLALRDYRELTERLLHM
ncbi:hypothetical protein OG226_33985 [Streptomyces sp. NBC_01261]|uniref:hypothetical protein n=1 Tax=Streptomyces sp. NBC_01261 TaxID=2903802 RepID=UPI002E378AA3|nr:hypothetical protein [Streptomyces sp. NBC_01261]